MDNLYLNPAIQDPILIRIRIVKDGFLISLLDVYQYPTHIRHILDYPYPKKSEKKIVSVDICSYTVRFHRYPLSSSILQLDLCQFWVSTEFTSCQFWVSPSMQFFEYLPPIHLVPIFNVNKIHI